MKRIAIAVLALAALACARAEAIDMNFDSAFNTSDISKFMKLLPPIISSIRFYPANPGPDDTVKVTTRVSRLKIDENDYEEIDEVNLYYTLDDGETWSKTNMRADDENIEWEGELPSVGSCGGVAFYVEARDTAGNVARVMSPENAMPGWQPGAPGTPFDYLDLIFEHEEADHREIPPYLDVISLRFGYDENNFYFRTEYKEPPQSGSISPFDVNFYLFAVANRSLVFDPDFLIKARSGIKEGGITEEQAMEMAQSVWAWYYAPPIEIAPAIGGVKFPASALVHPGQIDWSNTKAKKSDYKFQTLKTSKFAVEVFDRGAFSYKMNGKHIDLSIDRRLMGPSERDTINFATFNMRFVGADMMSAKPMQGDVSNSVSIVMEDYYYDTCAAD